jgi:hypothetical protein
MANDRPPTPELEPREPTLEDLRDLCRELNQRAARYIVVGGFAMRAAGYNRLTMDIDLLVADDPANESSVFSALATLPDNAVGEKGCDEGSGEGVHRRGSPDLSRKSQPAGTSVRMPKGVI